MIRGVSKCFGASRCLGCGLQGGTPAPSPIWVRCQPWSTTCCGMNSTLTKFQSELIPMLPQLKRRGNPLCPWQMGPMIGCQLWRVVWVGSVLAPSMELGGGHCPTEPHQPLVTDLLDVKLLFKASQPCPQLQAVPLALPSERGHPERGQKGQPRHYNQTPLCPELGLTCLLL